MPYPVPPPEPPAIVYPLPPQLLAPTTATPVGNWASPQTAATDNGEEENKEDKEGENILRLNAPLESVRSEEKVRNALPLDDDKELNLASIHWGDETPTPQAANFSCGTEFLSASPLSGARCEQETSSSLPTPSDRTPLKAEQGESQKVEAQVNKASPLHFPPVTQVPGNNRPTNVLPNLDLSPSQTTPLQPPLARPLPIVPARHAPPTPFPSERGSPVEQQISRVGHTAPTPFPAETRTQAQASSVGQPGQPTNIPTPSVGVIEVFADRQEFNEQRGVFTAEGNVTLRFQGALLEAERIQGNLGNFIAVAEGDAALTRGEQVLRGDRFVYNFLQNTGTIQNARGEIFVPTSGTDLTFTEPTTGGFTNVIPNRPLSDRLLEGQPPQQITSPGGITFTLGRGVGRQGTLNRIRFEAQEVEFYPRGWTATNVRLTNDPFSPPELEIRADEAIFTQLSPLRDQVQARRPRIVFDQGFSLPLFPRRIVIDRREREPPIVQIGYDGRDRGGLFVERTFDVINNDWLRWTVTPQFLVQRTVTELGGNIFNPDAYGLRSQLRANLSPRTVVQGNAVLTTLDFADQPENLRTTLRLSQIIGTRLPHIGTLEYTFRDRLFNGSLGYQTVRTNFGALITSPVIPLGIMGLNLTYQGSLRYISADTDRLDLLGIDFLNDPFAFDKFLALDNLRVGLGRFQASAAINRPIRLWRGQPLPATATEGLRYTPVPVVPFVQLVPSIRGTTNYYTSGDSQNSFTGTIALIGQFGHFSRPFLDYTGFNIQYTQIFNQGISPFFFDRIVDNRVLSFGITQQLYGPFRFGFQTSINLDTGQAISTDYIVEYSRRTYGVIVRYNPEREIGSINLRISDFNWTGGDQLFGGSGGGRLVEGGVIQDY